MSKDCLMLCKLQRFNLFVDTDQNHLKNILKKISLPGLLLVHNVGDHQH